MTLENTEKSPIHVVDVIQLMGRFTQNEVGNELLLKHGGAVDESGEYKVNERSADQGMTKQKITLMEKGTHELTERSNLSRISG